MLSDDHLRPNLSISEVSEIAEDVFGIFGSINELQSERDQNFHIIGEEGKEFVLKIANISEKKEVLDFQNQAMIHFTSNNIGVNHPKVIHSKTGEMITSLQIEGKNHFVRMLSFVKGKVIAEVKPHSSELMNTVGCFLGNISMGLIDFSHPETIRDFYWDLANASPIIRKYRGCVSDKSKLAILDKFLNLFEIQVLPALPKMRKSVIHSDTNDYNIIVDLNENAINLGIIDFGDMVYSCTVFELAIGIAYLILNKKEPIKYSSEIIAGYHSVYPLTKIELEHIFTLIAMRLCMSVSISAFQHTIEPENDYLIISQKPAWQTLNLLKEIQPRFAYYSFRKACGLEISPIPQEITDWSGRNKDKIGNLFDFDLNESSLTNIDLSVSSLELINAAEIMDTRILSELIDTKIKQKGVKIAVGNFDEVRMGYLRDEFKVEADEGSLWRTIHLGIDLFTTAETPIYSPLDGKLHSFQNNSGEYDYGSTLIIEHKFDKLSFYTLLGHLSEDSLDNKTEGMIIKRGDKIGKIGDYSINGNWPPHLHFQLITDMLGNKGNFPGVALHSEREIWLSICPNPNTILQLPESIFQKTKLSDEDLFRYRKAKIGDSLSLSYKVPLNIVQGFMQYLYNKTGRKFLDAVNNVPHVGHSHPRVVEALYRQAAILNTNTRYLHENLVNYAQLLCETLPEPLNVCYFVNSGSEANELALRLAYYYTGQRDIIVLDAAYHGNTDQLVKISPYKFDGPGGMGISENVHKVSLPDTYRGKYKKDDLDAGKKYAKEIATVVNKLSSQGRKPAAFIFESLPSCGGQIVLADNYLKNAFEYVRESGGICIADEVQIGFGRVGSHFWGFQIQDVVPDIVTLGKPIGNAHPLGAVITTTKIADKFANGMEYFSTTGGNPVSCAVGIAVLDIIKEENLQANALKVGNYLKSGLTKLMKNHPLIGEVRGRGLFIGVELVLDRETLEPAAKEATYIVNRMKDHGVLISVDGPLNNVLKIKPPMVFTKANADMLVMYLDKILEEDFVII